MVDYTFLETTNNPTIIRDQIEKSIGILLEEFNRFKVISIFLSGSAARGELAVISVKKHYIPFGDYDFRLITERKAPYTVIDKTAKRINRELFGGTDPKRGRLVDIDCKNRTVSLSMNCDLATYDFLSTYKVLWGNDFYFNKKLLFTNIPVISPFRLMMNRISHLAMSYTNAFQDRNPSEVEFADLRKTLLKTYLEIGGLITFLLGEYSSYFHERLEILSKNKNQLKWITNSSEIIDKIKKATIEKLNPEKIQYSDIYKERKIIAQYSLLLAKIISSKFHPKISEKTSDENFCIFLYKELPYLFFNDYIRYEIKKRFKVILPRNFYKIISQIANLIEYYSFQKKTQYTFLKKGNWRSPIIIYYFCTTWLLIATCLDDAKDISKEKALTEISQILSYDGSSIQHWEDVRNICKDIWYSYKSGKVR